MIVNKNQIIEAIGYEKVTEEKHEDYHRSDIIPDDESLPKAYLAFAVTNKEYFLLQAGFDEWHDHFDLSSDKEENLKQALSFFNDLVSGKCYMINAVDEKEQYVGGAIIDSKCQAAFA